MGEINLNGTGLGNQLMRLVNCDTIQPGDSPSYETCKIIYEYHPLGAKLVEAPIKLAQSQPRAISVSKGPEDRVRDVFRAEWNKLQCDELIFNVVKQSRIYGISSIVMLVNGEDTSTPIKLEKLAKAEISFNIFDPLNTAGSLIFNQNPNAVDFQKKKAGVTVQGVVYHGTRSFVQLNEDPIYLGWTTSAYGYVGRSVYQRTFYPMKSFLQTMKTDDMVTRKAGLIVAKIKQVGSIINAMMQNMAGIKRNLLKEAQTDNVISIDTDEEIQSIDLQNVNQAMSESRKNILNNIAAGAGMPAILVNEETFAEGFGEGSEDAKHVAMFIEDFRKGMAALYTWLDTIVQYRAWNEEFFETMQKEFPDEYKGKSYALAFSDWMQSFQATWPSLIVEPESEAAKKDDIKLKAIISLLEVLLPECDPDNKAAVIEWACDNFNALETLFTSPLIIDAQALAEYEPPMPGMGEDGETPAGSPPAAPKAPPKPPKPKTVNDGQKVRDAKAKIDAVIKANAGKK